MYRKPYPKFNNYRYLSINRLFISYTSISQTFFFLFYCSQDILLFTESDPHTPPTHFYPYPLCRPPPPPSSTDLNPLVCLVHELEEFVDYGLEKPPVSSKEARVLSHDVHYVGGYDGLVVLSFLLFT